MYETDAGICTERGVQPSIMEEYERYDVNLSEVQLSCLALSDELLALKGDSPFTFVDMYVDTPAEEVLSRIKKLRPDLLADDDEQLAMPSDGEYHPILDAKKTDARLVGVGLRVWGWDDEKYVFTNGSNESYDMSRHFLMYPSDEKTHRRQLEISFSYSHSSAGNIVESVSLALGSGGETSIYSQLYMSAYAETGYEGHGGRSSQNVSDGDMAAFGDLVAEIVGGVPESMRMRSERTLNELVYSAATEDARHAVMRLIEETWPAQALYLIASSRDGGAPLEDLLRDAAMSDVAVQRIDAIIARWSAM